MSDKEVVNWFDYYLEWLHHLHLEGYPIGSDNVRLLIDNHIITASDVAKIPYVHRYYEATERPITIKHEHELEADKHVDVVYSDNPQSTNVKFNVIRDDTEALEGEAIRYAGGREITKADWLPHKGNVLEPDDDFVEWIDSTLDGFSHAKEFNKFNLYIQQADDWIAKNYTSSECETYDELVEFVIDERARFTENSLYFLNKYLKLKQGAAEGGVVDFKAWRCQAFLAYLIDCGFSIGVGKLRQVGGTSMIGGLAICKMICHPNIFIKFITENLKKAEEIFNDKIKYAFYELPQIFRPTVKSETGHNLTFSPKTQKGKGKRRDARIVVEAPYLTAINGGTPDLVLVDEIGQINILGEMINEGRPTMFRVDEATGKMVMTRQVIMWGTGGNMDKAGGELEAEYRAWLKAWKERDFRNGIIPVFLDAFSKPAVTKEFYEKEKKKYYSVEGVKKEEKRVQFHQHYPITIEDMFLRSSKTLVSIAVINKHEDEILSRPHKERGSYGFFQPIYDYSQPQPEFSDVPYKVIGAEWVPTADHDESGVIYMKRHPIKGWDYRYYQGTDPINSESGHSLMSSTIWDEELKEVACCLNFRVPHYRYCYLQTALMNFYYGQCPHLIESNIGMNLRDYLYQMGLYKTLVTNAMLPEYLQVASAAEIGMRLIPNIKPRFIHVIIMMIETYGSGLNYLTFWSQLKTYVEHTTAAGNTKWKPENLKLYNDDVIDSHGFAYVCRMCYERHHPINRNSQPEERKVVRRLVYNKATGRNELQKVFK